MSVAQLVQEKGQPLKEESIPVQDGKVLHYAHDEKFQVKGEIVTNSFRNPKSDEASLLYWKNAFRDCETTEKILRPKGAGPAELEFRCQSQGISVVHAEGSDVVTRVLEYAPE